MTDLEMTKLCAEAMGYQIDIRETPFTAIGVKVMFAGPYDSPQFGVWNPLHDDAQAMALVKRFNLSLAMHNDGWVATPQYEPVSSSRSKTSSNLNRAIVECVAKMQESRDMTEHFA